MNDGVPLQRHHLGVQEVRAVQKVLGSTRLTRGSATRALEAEFARAVQAEHAVAFSSGTAAAYCLLAATGRWGRPLNLTPNTFVSVAHAAHMVGWSLAFRDIDPATGHVEFERDQETEWRLYQHHGGAVQRLPDAYEDRVIEDACHALGAVDFEGYPVGSCQRSLACFFSLHAAKAVAAGEGGMVTTNSVELRDALRAHRDSGRVGTVAQVISLNFHMTELQAAIAYPQVARLQKYLHRRRQAANRYRDMLRTVPGVELLSSPIQHGHHLFQVRVPEHRDALRVALAGKRIETAIHFPPANRQPSLTAIPYIDEQETPEAVRWGQQVLSLPLYDTITDPQVAVVCYEIRRFMEEVGNAQEK